RHAARNLSRRGAMCCAGRARRTVGALALGIVLAFGYRPVVRVSRLLRKQGARRYHGDWITRYRSLMTRRPIVFRPFALRTRFAPYLAGGVLALSAGAVASAQSLDTAGCLAKLRQMAPANGVAVADFDRLTQDAQ